MSFDFSTFNANEVDTTNEFSAIPANSYVCMLKDASLKPNGNNNGMIFSYRAEVIDGQYKGRLVFDNLNVSNPSETAEKIAKRQLAKMLLAIDMPQISMPEQINGKICIIKVGIDKDDNTRNKVLDYKKLDSGNQQQQPQVQASKPQQNSAPFQSGNKPPFMK